MGSATEIDLWVPGTNVNSISTISSLDNTAVIQQYGGSLTVNGINTAASAFYGTINIQPGAAFAVGNASHPTAVFGDPTGSTTHINVGWAAGFVGQLSGYGRIYGAVNNSGVVEPGGTAGSLGTLTVTTYTQSSTGILRVEVAPSGASKLAVTGPASLNGSLMITLDSGNYGNSVFQVLSAGSISGSFSSVSATGSTGSAIVGLNSTSTGFFVVTEKASSTQAFGHQVSSDRFNIEEFNRALLDRIDGRQKVTTGYSSVWLEPFGSIEVIGRSGIGYSNTVYGVRGGIEAQIPWHNFFFGVAGSYGTGSMDVKGDAITASSNTYNAAVYVGADVQNASLDGSLFYNIFDSTIRRDLGASGTAKSTPDGYAWGATAQIGQPLFHGLITPYVRGIFARIHQSAVTESGGGYFALNFDAINQNVFAGDFGIKAHIMKPTDAERTTLDIALAIEHDFSDKGEFITGSFASISGSSAQYTWKGDAENALLAAVYFDDQVADKVDVFARLDGQFSIYKHAGQISAGVKYRF
jgi:hypothetical protein